MDNSEGRKYKIWSGHGDDAKSEAISSKTFEGNSVAGIRDWFAHGINGCLGVGWTCHFYKRVTERTIGFLVDNDSDFSHLAKPAKGLSDFFFGDPLG